MTRPATQTRYRWLARFESGEYVQKLDWRGEACGILRTRDVFSAREFDSDRDVDMFHRAHPGCDPIVPCPVEIAITIAHL